MFHWPVRAGPKNTSNGILCWQPAEAVGAMMMRSWVGLGARFATRAPALCARPLWQQGKTTTVRWFAQHAPVVPQHAAHSGAMTLVGAGGLMVSTYLVLNHLLNKREGYSFGAIPSSVHEYMRGTYGYVLGGLGITAASAVVAFRQGAALRMLQMNPWGYMGLSLASVMGGTMITMSLSSTESPVMKHAAWVATMAAVGAVTMSPFALVPGPILYRAALYTAGIVGSLSLVSMNAEQGAFLYLGGPLFAGLTVVALSSISGMFLPVGGAAFNIAQSLSLYGGLVVFGGLVLYDTQVMMERGRIVARTGQHPDYINESFGLYWNILNIFIRMVDILLRHQGSQKK